MYGGCLCMAQSPSVVGCRASRKTSTTTDRPTTASECWTPEQFVFAKKWWWLVTTDGVEIPGCVSRNLRGLSPRRNECRRSADTPSQGNIAISHSLNHDSSFREHRQSNSRTPELQQRFTVALTVPSTAPKRRQATASATRDEPKRKEAKVK